MALLSCDAPGLYLTLTLLSAIPHHLNANPLNIITSIARSHPDWDPAITKQYIHITDINNEGYAIDDFPMTGVNGVILDQIQMLVNYYTAVASLTFEVGYSSITYNEVRPVIDVDWFSIEDPMLLHAYHIMHWLEVATCFDKYFGNTVSNVNMRVIKWVIRNSLINPVHNPRILILTGMGGNGKSECVKALLSLMPNRSEPLTKDYMGRPWLQITNKDMERILTSRIVAYGDFIMKDRYTINKEFIKMLAGGDTIATNTMKGRVNCSGLFAGNNLPFSTKAMLKPSISRHIIVLDFQKVTSALPTPPDQYNDFDISMFANKCIHSVVDVSVPADAKVLVRHDTHDKTDEASLSLSSKDHVWICYINGLQQGMTVIDTLHYFSKVNNSNFESFSLAYIAKQLLLPSKLEIGTYVGGKGNDTDLTDTLIYLEWYSEPPSMCKYQGGYVMDPVKGKHKNVMVFDYSLLYPSIVESCNISSETVQVIDKSTHLYESYYTLCGFDSVAANNGETQYRMMEGSWPRFIHVWDWTELTTFWISSMTL
ncbi:hypothetical protein BC830DRAFT_1083967 [Chytriomyces sp. MP71]|nr:hypothetical protein BC830DRAFT_1083967 [Chytriomyces sp. MP71]